MADAVEKNRRTALTKSLQILGKTSHPQGTQIDAEIIKMRKLLQESEPEPQKCRLLKKERENWDVGQDLGSMRADTRKRLQNCKEEKKRFEQKQIDLLNVVMSNEAFIKDTDVKIERAEKMAKDELLACKKAEEEILQLRLMYQDLEGSKGEEVEKILKHMRYKTFLADAAGIFADQKESLWRGDKRNPVGDGAGDTFITQNE